MKDTPESPLLIKFRTEFKSIGFGEVSMASGVAQLQRELDAVLGETISALPPSMVAEVGKLIATYAGRDRSFFGLFYVPTWSFLHWTAGPLSEEMRRDARIVHALSLFLHLWDDHLCDGQLELDLARLQLRSLAWKRFVETACRLCDAAGLDRAIVDEQASVYLVSQPDASAIGDLENYCRRFSNQIAIWTVVPRMIDHLSPRPAAVQRIVTAFALAWRIVDDVQDVDLDLLADKRTAVWTRLDPEGRRRWEECRARSTEKGRLEPETWQALCLSIREAGCLPTLLEKVDTLLQTAIGLADESGWPGWSRELTQSRPRR